MPFTQIMLVVSLEFPYVQAKEKKKQRDKPGTLVLTEGGLLLYCSIAWFALKYVSDGKSSQ